MIRVQLDLEPSIARALVAGLPALQKNVDTQVESTQNAMQKLGLDCLRRGLGDLFAAIDASLKKPE